MAWLLNGTRNELDDLPERLARFDAAEWSDVEVGGAGHFTGAGLDQLARFRRRSAWTLARVEWAEARGLSPGDLPQDEAS